MTAEPTILFEDTHLIVLSKPAGWLSQGGEASGPVLVDWLREHVGRPFVGLVHRLDRGTSGVMVAAKRTKSADRLTRALKDGHLDREYLAWVEGLLGPLGRPTRWEHYLAKNERTNRVTAYRALGPKAAGAKAASLSTIPIQAGAWQGNPLTLMRVKLETGRSHQIRAQSAFEGFPLLGDAKYGAKVAGFPRIALHSWRIAFPHPMSGEELRFEAELPAELQSLLTAPLPKD
jgi:23S rRNA pseudouridine1911/1915/1917 synthase